MNDEQRKLLSSLTDKELKHELYLRNKPIRISEKDKPKCGNCEHRVSYTAALKMKRKGLLVKNISSCVKYPICLVAEAGFTKEYYKRVDNSMTCDKFKRKEELHGYKFKY